MGRGRGHRGNKQQRQQPKQKSQRNNHFQRIANDIIHYSSNTNKNNNHKNADEVRDLATNILGSSVYCAGNDLENEENV